MNDAGRAAGDVASTAPHEAPSADTRPARHALLRDPAWLWLILPLVAALAFGFAIPGVASLGAEVAVISLIGAAGCIAALFLAPGSVRMRLVVDASIALGVAALVIDGRPTIATTDIHPLTALAPVVVTTAILLRASRGYRRDEPPVFRKRFIALATVDVLIGSASLAALVYQVWVREIFAENAPVVPALYAGVLTIGLLSMPLAAVVTALRYGCRFLPTAAGLTVLAWETIGRLDGGPHFLPSTIAAIAGTVAVVAWILGWRYDPLAAGRIRPRLEVAIPITIGMVSWATTVIIGQFIQMHSDGERALYVPALSLMVLVVLAATTLRATIDRRLHLLHADRFRELAYRDSLTLVGNRRELIRQMDATGTGALAMLDLDGFKNVNEARGHTAGDLVLRQVADRLVGLGRHRHEDYRELDGDNAFRDDDAGSGNAPRIADDPRAVAIHVARVGGDEFSVFVPGASGWHDAPDIAAKLRGLAVGGIRTSSGAIGFSAGLVDHHDDARLTLQEADNALMEAKAKRPGTTLLVDDEVRHRWQQQALIASHAADALHAKQFRPVYQPIVDAGGRVAAVEALARTTHPDLVDVDIGIVMEVLEAQARTGELDTVIYHLATRDAATWLAAGLFGPDMRLSLNASPASLADPGYADRIEEICAFRGFHPARIIVEVSEHAVIDPRSPMLAVLHRLRDVGARIALDDYGSGYTSVSQLHTLPVDVIKIDRSLVENIGSSPAHRAIVRHTLSLATDLGLSVIAEGVAEQPVFDLLCEWGCPWYQGFLFHPPLEEPDTARLLAAGVAQ